MHRRAVMLDDDLDRLAAWEPAGTPVLSLYLDTRPDDTGRRTFDIFLRNELPKRLETWPASSPERASLDADRERIARHLENGLQPSTKGLALFACSAAGLFEALPFDVPLENLIVLSDRPHLYPLARVLDQYPRYAAVLADTNQARIFVFSTGRQERELEVQGQQTKYPKVGGWSQARYQRHIDHIHLQHVKEIVDVLDDLVRREQIEHVVLAGDEVVIPMIREQLPKHLEDRILDVVRLDQRTPAHEVLAATLDVLREKDAESDEEVVDALIGEYRRGGLAVVGIDATLWALRQGQVDTLVLPASAEQIEGARIRPAGDAVPAPTVGAGLSAVDTRAAASGPTAETRPEIQAAGELVALARQTAARLRFIERAELLSPAGGVGALLRYAA
ncbi:MAG TPA: Vms1/Ankzf1 family peptidyl-tRNA hydrolase [Vicinamibacterales bacterium]